MKSIFASLISVVLFTACSNVNQTVETEETVIDTLAIDSVTVESIEVDTTLVDTVQEVAE